MVRIACCDDNEIHSRMLAGMLDTYMGERNQELNVSYYSSGKSLLESARIHPADIYILDILMPEMNGYEVALTLRMMKDDGLILFLTATPEFAVASYDVDAFYYMLKPANQSKLFSVLDRALKAIATAPSLQIKTKTGSVSVKVDEILYVDIVDRCLRYHIKDAAPLVTPVLRSSFKEAVTPLASEKGFVLCSASKMVNLAYVDAMDSESILLRDGTVLFPSKANRADLKAAFKVYKNGI